MAITRTAITDDDGSGTTGTALNNAWKQEFYDQIDDVVETVNSEVVATTATGTQDAFDLTTTALITTLRCNNATLLTLRGIAGGVEGRILRIISVGAGNVELAHQHATPTAVDRLINSATIGNTPLAAGSGTATYVYDSTSTRWRLVQHQQGALLTPTFAAGNFSPDTGTWTVDSGDAITYASLLEGRKLTVWFTINTTTVASSPNFLRVAIPGGFTAATKVFYNPIRVVDNNVSAIGYAVVDSGGTTIRCARVDGTVFSAATNTTYVLGQIMIEVQ